MNKNKVLAGLSASALTLVASSVLAAGPQLVESTVSAADVQFKNVVQANNGQQTEQFIIVFKEGAAGLSDGQSRSETVEFMVKDGEMNMRAIEAKLSAVGAKTMRSINKQRMVVAKMNKKAYNKLLQDASVEYISNDPARYIMAQSTPYGIPMVQATSLSQSDLDARKVCVIDTGYNLGHPDLPDTGDGVSGQANNSQVGSWNNDGNGHGTHVAGTIGALDNNTGVVGVYPGVDMHIVKIFNDSGSWTSASDLIAGIQQCADAGADVVNMSLGGGSSSTAERNAMQNFVNNGVMLIAAAGNDGNSTFSYPASYDAVISVGAVGSNESWASYSQYNSQVEISGPGSSVNSTYPTNTYASLSGTSMATPHVAGAAALVWSFFPQCSNEQIRAALNATAKDKGSSGRDNFYGHGIVQAKSAYDYLNANGCSGGSNGGGNNGGGVTPVSGQLTNLSGSTGNWARYTWDIPSGVATMNVSISGGSGDADLYLRFGSQPTTSAYDCRPYLNGNNESCTFNNPSVGTWHVGIRAYSAYSGVTMNYSYE